MNAPALAALPASALRPRFPDHSPLRQALRLRVDEYFARTGLDRAGGARMWGKSAVILGWTLASYLLLLLWAPAWWAAVPLAISLGLALACVGFSVMHDGGHGAYSGRRLVNRLAFGVLDLIGGSSYFWHHKHNVLHHTFTNVDGVDDDIDAGGFLRLAPTQPLRWFHRYQHWYGIPLLVFFVPKWVFVDDARTLARGKIGELPVPRPVGLDLVQLVFGKLFFCAWAVALPLALHPVAPTLLLFALVAAVLGVTLGVVFQLAHAVEGAAFTVSPGDGTRLERSWTEHQLATTVDFAPGGRLLGWYVGGLNFQVEHHLFPRVGHRHYAALAPIVREVCREHGVQHLTHATFWSALRSHLRFLRRMGRGEALLPAGVVPA